MYHDILLVLAVGVIGILNETLVVREDVGTVTVYVGFSQPAEISSDIVANITFFTEDSSAIGKHTHVLEIHFLDGCPFLFDFSTAGQDYIGVRESFILQRGSEIVGVPVTIINDMEFPENLELFETNIEAGSPLPARVTLDPAEGSINISDVPPPPTFSPEPPPPTVIPTRMITKYHIAGLLL